MDFAQRRTAFGTYPKILTEVFIDLPRNHVVTGYFANISFRQPKILTEVFIDLPRNHVVTGYFANISFRQR